MLLIDDEGIGISEVRKLEPGRRSGHEVRVQNLDVRNEERAERCFDDAIRLADEVDRALEDSNFVEVSCSAEFDAFEKLVVAVIDEDGHSNAIVDVGKSYGESDQFWI